MEHCTRTEEVHCLRIGCSAPTHKNKRGTDRTHLLPATTSPGASGGLIVPHGHCPTASVVQVARSDSCCALLILTPAATPQEPKPPQHNQGRQRPGSKPKGPQARQRDQGQQDSASSQQTATPPQRNQGRQRPGSKPEARRDRAPRLLVLRDVPLGDQTRILAGNKHLLRRLNDTTHVSDGAPHTHANTLRRHKVRTVMTISILPTLGFAVPALQNVAEVLVNHQGILQ